VAEFFLLGTPFRFGARTEHVDSEVCDRTPHASRVGGGVVAVFFRRTGTREPWFGCVKEPVVGVGCVLRQRRALDSGLLVTTPTDARTPQFFVSEVTVEHVVVEDLARTGPRVRE